jgi:hypothetical protein
VLVQVVRTTQFSSASKHMCVFWTEKKKVRSVAVRLPIKSEHPQLSHYYCTN